MDDITITLAGAEHQLILDALKDFAVRVNSEDFAGPRHARARLLDKIEALIERLAD